ncbi:hypothetical protein CHR29_01515 [Pseudomonas monteilii]|uniref:SGNH/GDSL hydrolase family protein n=1 Tax=Pseudomonas monteilii TaxID=76759 RepID=UPI000EF67A5F|nr:SGNH/GDSL hydrolase family protein [Pseudomonas monteilii]AYN13893.1 hypothetical protein CHR29_01515 [Pseudomonas monteilii]
MELKNYFAQDDGGNILPNAICYLYERGTEILVKNLQAADGTALVNPFTADDKGMVVFAAPNGLYDLRITKGARDSRIRVQCLDLTDHLNRLAGNPTPKDSPWLAKGDGVTNDTAAFAAFEAVVKGRRVDLGGSVFVLDELPKKNSYLNGAFKVGGFTRITALNDNLSAQPPRFHRIGGQLAMLKESLSNPLEQLTSLVVVADSIGWGSGTPGEQAVTDPRNGTLADPRNNFGAPSWFNEFARHIGERYAFNAAPVLSNWPASPSGECIVEYTVTHDLYPRGGRFNVQSVGPSVSVTDALTSGSVTNCQRVFGDGNPNGTSYHSVSFQFTGTTFALHFGVVGDDLNGGLDYELFVDGVSQGVHTTSAGEEGLTYGNNRIRNHTFGYVRNKTVEIRTKRRASQTTGTKALRIEAIRVKKTIRLTNQAINGATTRSYRMYNLPGNTQGHGNAVGPQDNFVLVGLGTNDRIRNPTQPQSVNEFSANLGALLDIVQPMANVILMCSNPSSNEDPEKYAFTMQDVRGEIYRTARARNLDMIDNYAALSIPDMSLIANDGLHPNALGYYLYSRNVIGSLEAA